MKNKIARFLRNLADIFNPIHIEQVEGAQYQWVEVKVNHKLLPHEMEYDPLIEYYKKLMFSNLAQKIEKYAEWERDKENLKVKLIVQQKVNL
ncbi:MAG: hypothetical protein FDW93_06445 [Bergeyella sp.]|nr:hypothetical protein [Bergeyella sp.]